MENYVHKVKYFETDKMGITHHSNYVRWMESARIDFLEKAGWNFARLESEGLVSPVLEIQCKYIHSTTFGDVVEAKVTVAECSRVRIKFHYVMTNEEGEKVFEGYSSHCFIKENGRPVRLEKDLPGFMDDMKKYLES